MSSSRKVADVGEEGVVALLRERFIAEPGTTGIGDDAAVFRSPGETLVFTTDTMVENVDFDLAYASGRDLGWKVVAVNVSDLAAMGAAPAHAVATMCLPGDTEIRLVEEVAEGLADAAVEWRVQLVGGDLSSAEVISIGIALLGTVHRPVLRSGASDGEAICVTGSLGGSAAGLERLRADPAASGPLVDRHLRPRARLDEGRRLREASVTAMIDISDGLVVDLARLMEASGVGCRVDPGSVPVDPNLLDEEDPIRAALFGGEDFELLFTVAAEKVEDARASLAEVGTEVTRIGTVTTDHRRIGQHDLDALKEETWDHLRHR